MKLYGVPLSPFVQKVRVVLEEKGIPYEIEDPAPYLHPMGKMPVLRDGDVVVFDSSVICTYLEKTHPSPALYPSDAAELAHALFLEEYADTQMAEGMGPIVLERIVKPNIFGQPTDEARLAQLLAVASERWFGKPTSASGRVIPCVMDYLESQIPTNRDSTLPRFGIADISIGAHLGWLEAAGLALDDRCWPRTARYFRAAARSTLVQEHHGALASA